MTTDDAMRRIRPDYLTDECWTRRHQSCSGYTEPETDPDLCECPCHDEDACAAA